MAPIFVRLPVTDDGKFTLELEDGTKLSEPMEVTVRSPSGERLAFAIQPTLSNFSIKVSPKTALTVALQTPVTDPALGPLKIRISIHDKTEQDRTANQLTSVWGIRADAAAVDPVQNVLGASYADAHGVTVVEISRAAYQSMEIEIPGHRAANKRFPLRLFDDGLPAETVD